MNSSMLSFTSLFAQGRSILLMLLLVTTAGELAGCGGGGSGGNIGSSSSGTSYPVSTYVHIVATPNPNVFPLLLALAQNPNLPAALTPVANINDAVTALTNGTAESLLSMTYTAAQNVTSGKVPGLELVSVNFWSGFWMLAPQSAAITQFSQLAGKGVLVSGPTSGGKGGGPDLIFQAAAKRAGLTASSFNLCYLPVMQAAPMMLQQQSMNSNSSCNAAYATAPTAISLVEPAATGLILDSQTTGGSSGLMVKAINFQSLFTGYSAWPQTELPHGGVSVMNTLINDSSRQAQLQAVLSAYRSAANSIMAAKGNLAAMSQIANTISAGITTYYGQYGLSIPPQAISAALMSGDFVFRTDLPINSVQTDLDSFLTEVVGTQPPSSFYHQM